MITYDALHELFRYEDGNLYWKVKPNRNIRLDSEAGTVNSNEYVVVTINGKKHMAHRIIWEMHGRESAPMIDHVNGNTADNRIENLRAADNSKNQMNSKLRTDNSSGIKGVSWCSTYKRWVGQVWENGHCHKIGRFKSKEECAAAVAAAREIIHGEFARQEVA
jgi:hypothetical protein